MGKSINKSLSEEERKFFEKFESNSNISDELSTAMQYGFFHFTESKNLKTKPKEENEDIKKGIEEVGLIATIGKNSKGYENTRRVYYAIGALGVVGIINRAIFIDMAKRIEKGIKPEEAKMEAFESISKHLEECVYLKLNIHDGEEYDSQDFMTRRNSHTKDNVPVPKEKITLVSYNGSDRAIDVFRFFCENCDISEIRCGEELFLGCKEENYIKEFCQFIDEREKKEEDTKKNKEITTTLRKMDFGTKSKDIEDSKPREIDRLVQDLLENAPTRENLVAEADAIEASTKSISRDKEEIGEYGNR